MSTYIIVMFLNLLPIVYCGGGWFVVLRTTLVHATDDDDDGDIACYYLEKASNALDALVVCKQKRVYCLTVVWTFQHWDHCFFSSPEVSLMLVVLHSQTHFCPLIYQWTILRAIISSFAYVISSLWSSLLIGLELGRYEIICIRLFAWTAQILPERYSWVDGWWKRLRSSQGHARDDDDDDDSDIAWLVSEIHTVMIQFRLIIQLF